MVVKGRKGRRGVVRGGKGEWRQSRQIVGINGGWRIMVLEGGHLVARIMQYVVSGWQPQSETPRTSQFPSAST